VYQGVSDYLENKNREYRLNRNDNTDRWDFIFANLSKDDESLLDIGCAEGYFVLEAANKGISATGYDRNYTRVKKAKKRGSKNSNASFKLCDVSPEYINDLPSADIILFLTIHHHWESQFGIKIAERMFSDLLDKSNKVFYEPPGNMKTMSAGTPKQPLNVDDCKTYYYEKLTERFGPEINIIDTKMVEYANDTDRIDPLFCIDSSNYTK